jgi:CheY-like chemotaxis protein
MNGATIMIVDDDADIRALMKIFLEADGYSVDLAADGCDALEHLRNGAQPVLILLDLMMPRMDGAQFLKQIRSTRFAKTPVVIMSGHNTAQKEAVELGATSCLPKPVELVDLLKTVHRFAA